jgi:hypothetical protein
VGESWTAEVICSRSELSCTSVDVLLRQEPDDEEDEEDDGEEEKEDGEDEEDDEGYSE